MNQIGLFEKDAKQGPLAHRLRPVSFEQYAGINRILSKYPFLKGQSIPSLIIWGPPGCGKTTLAHVLAHELDYKFLSFNAVLGGVKELRALIDEAKSLKEIGAKGVFILVDEIHRFNKAQQDALLPHVEVGDFNLIGATTENPKVSVNRALLSRCQIIPLTKHNKEELIQIINRGLEDLNLEIDNDLKSLIADYSSGDGRKALSALEIIKDDDDKSFESIKSKLSEGSRFYDKSGDRHYDVISAFIKSMRGTDPDSAILWLAVMLDGGEDPMFIARRLTIFASEDIGNADPRALTIATSAMQAISQIGMPEARIILAQATTYLASTVKSNASYRSIDEALAYVREQANLEVPTHLRNLHPDKQNYKYPHSFEGGYVPQKYSDADKGQFYRPKDLGQERFLKERLDKLK